MTDNGKGKGEDQGTIGAPMTKQELYHAVASKFGWSHQYDKALEELGELTTAMARFRSSSQRGLGISQSHKAAMIEELADVAIMVEQIAQIFDQEQFDKIKRFKLNRLAGLIGNEWGVKE
jgi:NTP pyrophosphatase (non-canonical NTP hydrolase)